MNQRVLYVKNFPNNSTFSLFEYIFKQFPGFEKAELLKDGEGLVTYLEKYYAKKAQEELNGF